MRMTDGNAVDGTDSRRIYRCKRCSWVGISGLRVPVCGKCHARIYDSDSIFPLPFGKGVKGGTLKKNGRVSAISSPRSPDHKGTTRTQYTQRVGFRRIYVCERCGWLGVSLLMIPRCGKCTKKAYDQSMIFPMIAGE